MDRPVPAEERAVQVEGPRSLDGVGGVQGRRPVCREADGPGRRVRFRNGTSRAARRDCYQGSVENWPHVAEVGDRRADSRVEAPARKGGGSRRWRRLAPSMSTGQWPTRCAGEPPTMVRRVLSARPTASGSPLRRWRLRWTQAHLRGSRSSMMSSGLPCGLSQFVTARSRAAGGMRCGEGPKIGGRCRRFDSGEGGRLGAPVPCGDLSHRRGTGGTISQTRAQGDAAFR